MSVEQTLEQVAETTSDGIHSYTNSVKAGMLTGSTMLNQAMRFAAKTTDQAVLAGSEEIAGALGYHANQHETGTNEGASQVAQGIHDHGVSTYRGMAAIAWICIIGIFVLLLIEMAAAVFYLLRWLRWDDAARTLFLVVFI